MKNEDKYHESGDQDRPPQHIEEQEWHEYCEAPASFDLKTQAERMLDNCNYDDKLHEGYFNAITEAQTTQQVYDIINELKTSPVRSEGFRMKDINKRLDDRLNREK